MNASLSQKSVKVPHVKAKLDAFIHFFCFLSLLFIGADRFGMEIGGVNFRIAQIFLAIFVFLMIVKGNFRLTKNLWVVAFVLFSALSTLFAFSFVRAFAFWLSIVYNVFFLFYGICSYIQCYGLERLIGIFRASCFVQFAVLLVQLSLTVLFHYELPFMPSYGYYMGVPRFQIWFYEPSYFATFLSFWFALACMKLIVYGERRYVSDLICGLIMFLISTSTSGFLAIAFVIVTTYLVWIKRKITLKKLIFPLLVLVLFLVFRFGFSSIYDLFFARLFENSLNDASGGRIERWAETWKVFLENPIFGVGPGCYGLYLGGDTSLVPTNVTLDLMATVGILGFVAFYGLTLSLIVRAFRLHRRAKTKDTRTLLCLAYALFVFTVILQTNQGYLRLYHWAFFGILWGGIKYLSVKKRGTMA